MPHFCAGIISSASLLLFVWSTTRLLSPSHGFSLVITAPSRKSLVRHRASSSSRRYGLSREEEFDLEAARRRLEALVEQPGQHRLASNNNNAQQRTYSSPPSALLDVVLPAPLTTMDRQRRRIEIQLLSSLKDGDEALTDLWNVWFHERGAEAAAKLMQAEELTSQGPRRWDEAENVLRGLVEMYGAHWAEPLNRLATLYYLKGRLEEAETLCKMVLAVKPWHFGALSGIVLVYAGLRDSEQARLWAAKRLPSFAAAGSNRRRSVWVDAAVRDATKALMTAEQRTLDSFGEPDGHYTTDENTLKNLDENEWQ